MKYVFVSMGAYCIVPRQGLVYCFEIDTNLQSITNILSDVIISKFTSIQYLSSDKNKNKSSHCLILTIV
jgi:hypothetical protein